MADDALPPLPKPKYGLLKPQPLKYQRADNPPAAEKNSQEERDRSSPDTTPEERDAEKQRKAAQKVKSTQQFTAQTSSALGYQEPDRYQPAQGQSRLGKRLVKDPQTGEYKETRDYVDVPQASRRQGLYIIGIQGTGKTGLIENLMLQDIKQGLGVCLLDPHGDLTNAVLSRLPAEREQDVVFLDLAEYRYPFGINLFTCADPSNPAAVSEAASKVMHIFKKLWGKGGIVVEDAWGVLLEEILWNTTLTFLEASKDTVYTMAEIPLLLEEREFRNHVVNHITNRHVKRYWVHKYNPLSEKDQREEIRSTLNRVNAFLTQPIVEHIVGQARTTIDFRAIMDERKILLVKLSKRHEAVTALIGSMVIAGLLNAAYSRTDLPVNKRKQFNIYADEFQNFATDDFTTLLEEARKFGIGISIAHQNRGQLEFSLKDRIRSVANLVVFKINSKDADELAGEFDITPQEAWEEEFEPIRFERVEEQVADEVEEEIEEISHTPFDHLERGSHRSAKVRETVQAIKRPTYFPLAPDMPTEPLAVYLTRFPEHRGVDHNPLIGSEYFNALLVDVMEGRLSLGTNALAVRIFPIVQSLAPYIKWLGSGAVGATWWYAYESLPSHIATLISKVYMTKEDYEKYTRGLRREGEEPEVYKRLFALIWGLVSGQGRLDRLKQDMADALSDVFVLEIGGNLYHYYSKRVYEIEKAKDSFYKLAEAEKEIERIHSNVKESVSKATQIITEWTPLIVNGVVIYVSHWLTLCEELAKEENHIKVPTGQKRLVPKMRTHVTYHTIPAKTIMHPQRTYADVLNEVASQIANLPAYTARVKVATDNGNEEHTIKTLDPKQEHDKPLFGQALQERKDRIKEQNIKDGYVRERTEVEAEIIKRQEQSSQPPEEPPISRRPRR
jgi:hypothetical protein